VGVGADVVVNKFVMQGGSQQGYDFSQENIFDSRL